MKNFLKKLSNKSNLLIIAIFAFAIVIRFYNFSYRVVYGPEQGLSLLTAAENIKAPSLLGIPYLLRQTSTGLSLFVSPLFLYSLVPFILIFKFNVFGITSIFTLINLVTGITVFCVTKKLFNKKAAIFALTLFLFSDYMIYHSLFIWISNYMPLIGVATFYCLYRFASAKKKYTLAFLLGLLSGIGFGIQYLYLFGALLVFILLLKFSKKKFLDATLFIAGAVVGELPTVLFDLKHNFYNVKTLFEYFLDTTRHPGQSQISYYHFLVVWPIVAIFIGILLTKLYKKSKLLSVLLIVVYIIINLLSPRISFKHAIGMPENLTANDILYTSKVISDDNPKDFNVAVLMDFDNRAYILRYPLEFVYGKIPLGVEDYPNAGSLYVLANDKYNFYGEGIWEVSSFHPTKVKVLKDLGDGYSVFKLTK